jgi:hypothetical protein
VKKENEKYGKHILTLPRKMRERKRKLKLTKGWQMKERVQENEK